MRVRRTVTGEITVARIELEDAALIGRDGLWRVQVEHGALTSNVLREDIGEAMA